MQSRLLEASAAGNSSTVRKLLRAKVVDPDVKDDLHQSALTLACKGERALCLISADIDRLFDAMTVFRPTPL